MLFTRPSSDPLSDELLKKGLTDVWTKMNKKYIDQLKQEFKQWLNKDSKANASPELALTEFMLFQVDETAESILNLTRKLTEFNRRYFRSTGNDERHEHILEFSADLGANKRTLQKDRKAFKRWFDRDAILERFHSKLSAQQQRLSFYLERLGWVYAESIVRHDNPEKFWHRYDLEETVRPLFVFEGDNRVRVAAFHCLARALYALPQESHEKLISDATLKYIYRATLEKTQDVLIQREALSLLGCLSFKSFQLVLSKRITEPVSGDDFFIRRHAVFLIGEYQAQIPELKNLLTVAARDESAAVRQNVAKALIHSSASFAQPILTELVLRDSEAAVSGASILCILDFLQKDEYFDVICELMTNCYKSEGDKFVLKVMLKVSIDALTLLDDDRQQRWINKILSAIETLHYSANSTEIRRLSAQVMEWFWLYQSAQAKKLYDDLVSMLVNLNEGRALKIPAHISYKDDIQLARVLSLIAQHDHGFVVEDRYFGRFILKGDRFKFRFWRFIYELRNSSTDKRQSHRHTTGRHFFGLLRAPSSIMSELAETKVPGEPLLISDEDGSRPYLPLVDDVLSALDQGWPTKPYQIVSSEGITEIIPPCNLWQRFKAQTQLSLGFQKYARKRNWLETSQSDPDSYIAALKQLGFEINYRPHNYDHSLASVEDLKVKRFFPAVIPFDLTGTFEEVKDYFFSVYENTLMHLGVFVVLVSTYFFGRHIYLNTQMRKARNSIPLVIGGWGTRGKSGTERLKAALFNALGYSVVSKTSGCEAMFLHSTAYGSLREMFLFRPYDKATIWEQIDVVRLSAKLNCDVFLWECMGLTPSYVHVLQKDWMRDDIANITNTYPDHEDLQGPAGHEIPRVMTNFIPNSSVLIASEEQMLPILAESARTFNTKIRAVGWLQAGLLTDDILQRFPYEEHPYNIALVLEMADELGIDKDFALKEMADRVVPDLGVLKTYPLSTINTRQLEFVMGMSANERFGAMSNWTRMAFDQHELIKDPEVWVTTVINNRADRVPRSRVFASIIATDVSVDRHILIGNNLQGLKGYVHDAWNDNLHELSLFEQKTNEEIEARLNKICRHFRVPVSDAELSARVTAMLKGLDLIDQGLENIWRQPAELQQKLSTLEFAVDGVVEGAVDAAEICSAIAQMIQLNDDYQIFLARLQNETDQEKLQNDFNVLAWSWMESKIIIVENYYASGDEVINTIVQQTPPGLKARIMGMQNIKGTGLDYVYRWQAWDNCYQACRKILSSDHLAAQEGVKSLSQFKEYGPLCSEAVLKTLEQVKDRSWTQREDIHAEFAMITSNMNQALNKITEAANKPELSSVWATKLAEYLEAFFDAGDAVKRRKCANQIYEDLQNKRISHDRAAMELQILNKRQKGGWADEYITKLRSTD